jgi:hypothetical protein
MAKDTWLAPCVDALLVPQMWVGRVLRRSKTPPIRLCSCSQTAKGWLSPTAQHARNDELHRRLACLHLRLVTSEERDGFYQAAGRLLALCEPLATADELLP